MGATGFDGAW